MFVGLWMANCSTCGVVHDRFRDAAHTKPQSYCHSCHASHMRKTRPKHSELDPVAKWKANVRSYANTYQKRGYLIPEPCAMCKSMEVQKHHADYSQP